MFTFSGPGESPPPPPRAFFGRDELIEKIVGLVENLAPIALVGTGGIGKTSIALTVLHDSRIKQRFGDNRWFIRCDQFPASRAHFLRRLSKVVGAGIENPEDLSSLRQFISSREMLVVLDNAESILDLQGKNADEVYAVAEELSQFSNVCLCITSRTSTFPPDCEAFDIPTLSMEAARDTFYRIYRRGEPSDLVNNILGQLDFHPLSITLLATVAQQNRWDADRLITEWERRRTGVLHARHSRSLAATIELSLASPIFQELGPEARELLGVVAFFPQGIDEKNIGWLLPTVPDGPNTFDKFCALSLTYRGNGFLTMLAPLRDYLRPRGPKSSPLLTMVKDCYFRRLSVEVLPDKPSYEEARWIVSEDVNVEHLLDVFTSIDANSADIWDTCAHFMEHLYWHKSRLPVLGPRIEGLPDDHPSKPRCLFELSRIFEAVGNDAEYKRLLTCVLKLQKQRGDDRGVARTLRHLSNANRLLNIHLEGVRQAEEALEIYERLCDTAGQAQCLSFLAWVLYSDKQLDAAEAVASRAVNLLLEEGEQHELCICYHVLGDIYKSKDETEKAVYNLEIALEIASSFNWVDQLFWIHYSLARLFLDEGKFDEAQTCIGRVKSHAIRSGTYELGRAMELQAELKQHIIQTWCGYIQRRFEEAKAEALRAVDVFEKLGAENYAEYTRQLLLRVEWASYDGELGIASLIFIQ
jgi:tetratricopeptide (TPR) repeat protein